MAIVTRFACFSLVLFSTLFACGDEYPLLTKELARINAMSTDPNGRRVISRLISARFQVPHSDVLAVRRRLNLNYGSTFLFFHLASAGLDSRKVANDMAAGKNLYQVGTENSVDWKRAASKAKDFNKKLKNQLFNYFVRETEIRAEDTAANYIPALDAVPADAEGYTDSDVDQARDLFQRQRQRASSLDPESHGIDAMNENQIRHSHDQIRDGFPSAAAAGR